jgi:hypothetical protein
MEPRFLLRIAGAVLTGILGALAAFLLSLPDRSRLWALAPAPGLVLWLSATGSQCLTDWVNVTPGGVRPGATAVCFATMVLVSLPLSLVMHLMLRSASPLRPAPAILSGSLAVAAMTAAGLGLCRVQDFTAMILIWNLGGTAAVIGASSFSKLRVGLPLPSPPTAFPR